jgi:hypothetical protein
LEGFNNRDFTTSPHLSKIHGWILQLLEVQIQILGAQLGPAYLNDCIMEVGIKILLTPMSQ